MKVYEYLAAGLPVVATGLPALAGVDGVDLVDGAPEMLAAVERALARGLSRAPTRAQRSGRARTRGRPGWRRSRAAWRYERSGCELDDPDPRERNRPAGLRRRRGAGPPQAGRGRLRRVGRGGARGRVPAARERHAARAARLARPGADARVRAGSARQVPTGLARGVSPGLRTAGRAAPAGRARDRGRTGGRGRPARLARAREVVYLAHNLESSGFRRESERAGLERFEREVLRTFSECWMATRADERGARALAGDDVRDALRPERHGRRPASSR